MKLGWLGAGAEDFHAAYVEMSKLGLARSAWPRPPICCSVTSLSRRVASPERLLAIRRRHWLIETGLHYRRDVTFHEDATRMTLGAAGHILSITPDLVLGLLKTAGFTNAAQVRRWFDGHLPEAFALLIGQPALS